MSKVDHYVGQLIQNLKDMGFYHKTLIIFTSGHG
ncbi:MAG: alkaline phosphatase family protein [Rhodospirillales bacterium]